MERPRIDLHVDAANPHLFTITDDERDAAKAVRISQFPSGKLAEAVDLHVCSVYARCVDGDLTDAAVRALHARRVLNVLRWYEQHDGIRLVRSYDDWPSATHDPRIEDRHNVMLQLEGVDWIGGVDVLLELVRRGVRIVQPIYNSCSPVGRSSKDPSDDGLTEWGRWLVQILSWLGVGIDIAHASHKSMEDILRWSEQGRAPVMYTHGCLGDFHPILGERSLPLAIEKEILNRGGLIGITPIYPFFESLETVVEAIFAFADRHGKFDGLCIGTDMGGIDGKFRGKPTFFPGMTNQANVFEELAKELHFRGAGLPDIEAVMGENAEQTLVHNILHDCESVAASPDQLVAEAEVEPSVPQS